jgi:uncharacterized membrane protein
MARVQQQSSRGAAGRSGNGRGQQEFSAPLQFRQVRQASSRGGQDGRTKNVSDAERMVSVASGSILALLGVGRRDLTGALIAGVGGALIFRGATGHCAMYQALGVDTAHEGADQRKTKDHTSGVHIAHSLLINKSPEELYSFWRNFENFPQFMSHLESVRRIDDQRSHWVAKAPRIYGGKVEWDAEITADEPNSRIAWRALPGADIEHRGSVRFERALGDRGTRVRVHLDYDPPLGQIGRWLAKLFGEEPELQIRDDLRKFKRIMEVGEVPTIIGQPHGTCTGRGERYTESSWPVFG